MRSRPMLELADARRIVEAAEQEALRLGLKVSIAVCDDGGHPIALVRMDGAPPMGAGLAPEKARTSVMMRRASKTAEDMVNGGRVAALRMPVVPLEGGEMIVLGGDCVGAVGVSGAKASKDAQVARYGISVIGATVG